MLAIIGMVVVVVMVFGDYMPAGGNIAIVLQVLPFEMMIIGGAAVDTLMIAMAGRPCAARWATCAA
jgi:chemotaxis protein MotA